MANPGYVWQKGCRCILTSGKHIISGSYVCCRSYSIVSIGTLSQTGHCKSCTRPETCGAAPNYASQVELLQMWYSSKPTIITDAVFFLQSLQPSLLLSSDLRKPSGGIRRLPLVVSGKL